MDGLRRSVSFDLKTSQVWTPSAITTHMTVCMQGSTVPLLLNSINSLKTDYAQLTAFKAKV